MTPKTLAPGRPTRFRARANREAPTITIVVASKRPRAVLSRCLASVIPQCERLSAELVVARAGTAPELMELRAAMPGVVFVSAPQSATIAELRALGMAQSNGDIVALTDDQGALDEGWVEKLLGHSGAGHARARAVR